MKKIITILAVFTAMNAQSQLQETITYSMKMENNPAAAMMGDMKITLYSKNGKSLTDMSSQMASSKTLVTDSGSLTLMSAMGQKFYIKAPGLPHNGTVKMPDIRYTTQTKQIAGYTCTKAYLVVKQDNGADTAVFWYTEKLPLVAFGKEADLYKGLKGMPLEYTVNTPQVKLTVTAQKVSLGPIPDSVFALSTEGYTQLDSSMLKQFQQ